MVSELVETVVRLPRDLRDALRAVAAREGRDEGDVMRDAFSDYVRRNRRDIDPEGARLLPRSIGIASDPDLSSEDVEEWLKANWRPEEEWRAE
jgi:hypothetical protein